MKTTMAGDIWEKARKRDASLEDGVSEVDIYGCDLYINGWG